jgi:hypothetical protein
MYLPLVAFPADPNVCGSPDRCFTWVGFDLTSINLTRLQGFLVKNPLAYNECL